MQWCVQVFWRGVYDFFTILLDHVTYSGEYASTASSHIFYMTQTSQRWGVIWHPHTPVSTLLGGWKIIVDRNVSYPCIVLLYLYTHCRYMFCAVYSIPKYCKLSGLKWHVELAYDKMSIGRYKNLFCSQVLRRIRVYKIYIL